MASKLSTFNSALAVGALLVSGAASADPVVTGSSYLAAILGNVSGVTFFTATFDGVAETVTRNIGGTDYSFTLNESQTSLGGGNYRISFVFTGLQLAQAADTNMGVGVGLLGNALDLTADFDLLSSQTRVYNSAGTLLGVGGGPDTLQQPWDGAWPSPTSAAGFAGSSGLDTITRFELDLNVADLPEPGSLALCGVGLAAAALVRRRRDAGFLPKAV